MYFKRNNVNIRFLALYCTFFDRGQIFYLALWSLGILLSYTLRTWNYCSSICIKLETFFTHAQYSTLWTVVNRENVESNFLQNKIWTLWTLNHYSFEIRTFDPAALQNNKLIMNFFRECSVRLQAVKRARSINQKMLLYWFSAVLLLSIYIVFIFFSF